VNLQAATLGNDLPPVLLAPSATLHNKKEPLRAQRELWASACAKSNIERS